VYCALTWKVPAHNNKSSGPLTRIAERPPRLTPKMPAFRHFRTRKPSDVTYIDEIYPSVKSHLQFYA
ncbi:hypothetical protein Ancab_004990, partial [Ancistrocladus abbreviatus]